MSGIGSRRRLSAVRLAAALLASAASAAPAWALFKVVGPDGRVTYTDRPPAQPNAAVLPLREAPRHAAGLPPSLQRLAERFPVTLYTAPGCGPTCDAARRLLQQRGIPHTERRVASGAEVEALERLSGGREAPTLAIGGQVLRGLAEPLWQQVLDAAGYPPTSQLPRDWRPPAPRPLIESIEATPALRSVPAAPPVDARLPASPPAGAGGIRF